MINKTQEVPVYYIFNVKNDKGFIIISAEDNVYPVLGYSTESNYSTENQPPAFIDWMKNYEKQILFAKKNNLQTDKKTQNKLWETYKSLIKSSNFKLTKDIVPLLTTTWNQGCYYNDSCPADTDGPCGHCHTGCVATAMAQIMKYWNHPSQGIGSHSYTHSTYGTLSANFGSTTYNWDDMPNNLSSYNSDVAQLMYHCGVSLDMHYSPSGSIASYSDVDDALLLYFNYSPEMTLKSKSNYADSTWGNFLKNELDSLNPVYYAGCGTGCHAFVCDGYQNNNYFHFNWGWGGASDGYFYLNDLTYNSNQHAIFGIKPSTAPIINFTQINLNEKLSGSGAWGDYANDGDLDILFIARDMDYNGFSKIYRNDGNNQFSDINANLTGVRDGSVDWGDYDNDGDVDILFTGIDESNNKISKIYRNDGNNIFTDINAGLTGVYLSSSAWGDYDNDGDMDILFTGIDESNNKISKIYRNDGNDKFSDINANIIGVYFGSVAWGDYDNDGDLDILLTGKQDNNCIGISKIYRNNGNNQFADINANLIGVWGSSVAWGDYDNVGDLDILLAGLLDNNYNKISKIYRNDGNNEFFDINANINSNSVSQGGWGDYDNNGNLDILVNTVLGIFSNDSNNTFTYNRISSTDISNNDTKWGDYDNDGDLDIFASGNIFEESVMIYRNEISVLNSIPSSPINLYSVVNGNNVILNWDKSTDNETPQDGLSYNIFIGTNPDTCDIMSPMSDLNTGYRRIPAMGNTNLNSRWEIKNLDFGIYYWSVQAVDNAFASSPFSPVDSFIIAPTSYFNSTIDTICAYEYDTIIYNGNATDSASYNWDFVGGNIISGSGQGPYIINWTDCGLKNIKLSVTENNATSVTSTIQVLVNSLPIVELGNDIIICFGNDTTLNAGDGFIDYLWSTGLNDSIITINEQGIYSITVTDINNCSNSDTFEVTTDLPFVDLGKDTTIYNNEMIILDAGAGFKEYLWNNGLTSRSISVVGSFLDTISYTYSVIVTNYNNCINSDTIVVTIKSSVDVFSINTVPSIIKIYPNPATNTINIVFEDKSYKDVKVSLLNIQGQTISGIKQTTVNSNTLQLNLSSCSNGIYYLNIQTDKGTIVKKISVMK